MSGAAGTMVDLIGPAWSSWLDLARNIFLILIAPSLFLVSWLVDRTSATHRLIHNLVCPPVMAQAERLRVYRKFKQHQSTYDPYGPDAQGQSDHDLLFDLATFLNYYESVCAEIDHGNVWNGRVYKVAASMIIGVQHLQLQWFDELTEDDATEVFPEICTMAGKSKAWMDKRDMSIFDRLRPKQNSQ